MSLTPNASANASAAARRYDRKMARWRNVVDWAKHRPWALKMIEPLSRGRGRFRFVDRFTSDPSPAGVRPDLSRWESESLAASWLGHATILLRIGGKTVLTDPVFSRRVGLGWGFGTLGPARFVEPALRIDELPPIDLVVSSHAHFDHLDRPSLSRLARRRTGVVCAPGTSDLFSDLAFGNVIKVEPGESVDVDGIKITGWPVRHWGARIVLDEFRGYCAFSLESGDARVLYGADSAYQERWAPLGASGGVDLAIVGIGAYDPWIGGHANPEQAWAMAMQAGARKVLPMHHSTFKLSQEPMDEPLHRLLIAAGDRADDVVCRQIGELWRRA